MSLDARLHSAACERNREPILAVLREHLPDAGGLLLEIAAGTGMHGVFMAPRLPSWTWQPTDADPAALASVEAWRRAEPCERLLEARALDVRDAEWPVDRADAIFNANMIHISPWACTLGLFAGAARVLSTGAPMITYGPYTIDGEHTAPSNEAFDASLRARDPSWGVRDLDEIAEVADAHGLSLEARVAMPANNFCVVWRRG